MKPLAKSKGVMMEEPEYFGPKSFSRESIEHFPELAAELQHDAELLSVQMSTLALSARTAIQRGDVAFLRRLFAFLDNILARPKLFSEIQNAVETSFLMPADFEASQCGREMWASLPEKLKHALHRAV
jgi:hypothetical protein